MKTILFGGFCGIFLGGRLFFVLFCLWGVLWVLFYFLFFLN